MSTAVSRPAAAESATVNVADVLPAAPSATDTSSTVKDGSASSSVIEPTPWGAVTGAPDALVRSTVKVSVSSLSASCTIGTETDFEV